MSVELLAFNSAGRTFAYRRLDQGLSRALSAFSCFMREYFDSVKTSRTKTDNQKMSLWSNTGRVPRKNHHARRSKPARQKVKKIPQSPFPEIKKASPKNIGLVNYYRNYIPRLSGKLIGMCELLKADSKIRLSEELVDNFKEINASLAEACGLALRQLVAGKQYVLMTDASFRASDYALMIEENDERKLLSKRKTFAPVAFGLRVFSPAQLKMPIYCKEFLAIYHAFLEYSHILWEATIPTLVLTDNRSVTSFSQTKSTPPALWNACD